MALVSLVSSSHLQNWKETSVETKEYLFEELKQGRIKFKDIRLTYDVTDATLYKLLKKYKDGQPLYTFTENKKVMGRPHLLTTEDYERIKSQYKNFPNYTSIKQNKIIKSAILLANPSHSTASKQYLQRIRSEILELYDR